MYDWEMRHLSPGWCHHDAQSSSARIFNMGIANIWNITTHTHTTFATSFTWWHGEIKAFGETSEQEFQIDVWDKRAHSTCLLVFREPCTHKLGSCLNWQTDGCHSLGQSRGKRPTVCDSRNRNWPVNSTPQRCCNNEFQETFMDFNGKS